MSRFVLVLVSLFVLTASSFGKEDDAAGDADYLFYPSPPELPRLQFLKTFSKASDVSSSNKGLQSFLFGELDQSQHLVGKPYGLAIHDGAIYVVDTDGAGWGIFDIANGKTSFVRPGGGGTLRMPINISSRQNRSKY